jgi:hypothetical protein
VYIIFKTLLQHVSVRVYHHQGAQMPKLKPTAGDVTMLQDMMIDDRHLSQYTVIDDRHVSPYIVI